MIERGNPMIDKCHSCDREVSVDDWGVYSNDNKYFCGHCCDIMSKLSDQDGGDPDEETKES